MQLPTSALLLYGIVAAAVLIYVPFPVVAYGRVKAGYDIAAPRALFDKLPAYAQRATWLSADEVYTLVKVLPEFSQKLRLEVYAGIVQDLLEQNLTDVSGSLDFCRKLRQELQVKDADHFTAIEAIAASHPEVLISAYARQSPAQVHDAKTLAITAAKQVDAQVSHPTTAHSKPSPNTRKRRN
ncbi:hypothetical protein [Leptolyngbya sp. 7M]|uniref:hypothetical protein n=1 Tax=Leptolyngbya sp. 7M TaxID=2812896 RepID=UPI001B8C537E|nr:hypothetical protein [Leptolyngbya sp. 7M]QYO68933.1 hypothetical protein JVX88_14725 [Leptolyngbya sp. 7M]